MRGDGGPGTRPLIAPGFWRRGLHILSWAAAAVTIIIGVDVALRVFGYGVTVSGKLLRDIFGPNYPLLGMAYPVFVVVIWWITGRSDDQLLADQTAEAAPGDGGVQGAPNQAGVSGGQPPAPG